MCDICQQCEYEDQEIEQICVHEEILAAIRYFVHEKHLILKDRCIIISMFENLYSFSFIPRDLDLWPVWEQDNVKSYLHNLTEHRISHK